MASSLALNNCAFSPVGEFLSSFVIMQSMRYTVHELLFSTFHWFLGTIHGYNLRMCTISGPKDGWRGRPPKKLGVI